MMRIQTLLFAFFFMCLGFHANAQCDKTAAACESLLGKNFLSDGQQYRALLNGTEAAEFRNVFYGGNTYRIACGSGQSTGNLQVRMYDAERNVLYDSADFGNPAVWDFKFKSTVNCTLEATLLPNSNGESSSGCAVLLIGFSK